MSNRSIHENGKLLVEVGSKVVTRDGREGRVICVDRDAERPVVCLIRDPDINEGEFEVLETYASDGSCFLGAGESIWDIFLPPKKRTLRLYESKQHEGVFLGSCGDGHFCMPHPEQYKFHSEIEIED